MFFLLAQMLECRSFLFLYGAAHFLEYTLSHGWVEKRLSTRDGFECLHEIVAADLLEDISRSASADRREQHLIFRVRREHNDLDIWMFRDDLLTCFDPRSSGQANIHHHYIGLERIGLFNCLTRRTGFRDYVELGITFQ